jgi:hypothetical protein
METDKLSKIALSCILLVMSSGASYEEGRAIFVALSALMEQIGLTPDADDDMLCALADSVIQSELNRNEKAVS